MQVGIRIRPFNDREQKLNAQLCIDMVGPMTILNPPETTEEGRQKEVKKFTFDASFWSHDGFVEEPGGYFRPMPGGRYADQQLVYETFGKQVLDNAWEGYHCCLFAYGQTGSGKSYSMVGYGANKGIVPISCEQIFIRIGANQDPNLSYEVTVSMVEIYNEAVQDLMIAPKDRPKKGLDIRESQQLGIYIAGVVKTPVDSYKAIERVVEQGTEHRSLGATLMNATSSRAHTVLTIEFKQVSHAGGATGCKVSLINLVDLAGSEKAGQTGATGDRLKEGSAINKSLSALGNVIEKLADRATGKSKPGAVIPYRDSKLTRLLQNALGGSSKTVMICAISPASSNYEETLSTLRYADRAKRIKNSAVVNENPQDKLIRQLREENQNLKDLIGGGSQASGINEEEMQQKQAEIAALEEALHEMQQSFSERLAHAKREAEREQAAKLKGKADLTHPHIANINEDALLTNKLQFAFKEGRTTVGRVAGHGEKKGKAKEPDIILAGIGIQRQHAIVVNHKGTCTMDAIGPACQTTFVNGASPDPDGSFPVLKHGDRICFGQSIFLFIDPSKGSAQGLLASGEVSFADARKELAEHQGALGGASEEEMAENRKRAEELERRAREAENARKAAEAEAADLLRKREEEYKFKIEHLQQEQRRQLQEREQAKAHGEAAVVEQAKVMKDAHSRELARLQKEFEDRQRLAEEASARRIEELQKKAQRAHAEEDEHRQHEQNIRKLEEQLMWVMPLVKEANLIAAELQKVHRLETTMQVDLTGDPRNRGTIRVTATVLQDHVRLYEWSAETLENRVFLLRELLQRVEEEGPDVLSNLRNEEDPLWDPLEPERLIGVAQVLLEGLMQQVDNQLDARILSTEGKQAGTLRVELWPLSKDGTPGVPDEEAVDDPEDLLGSKMGLLLRVPRATGLPEALAHDVRAEYDYFIEERPLQLPGVKGFNCQPEFGYEKTFVQDPVTSRFLDYLRTKTIQFRIYGKHVAAEKMLEQTSKEKAALARSPPPSPAAASLVTDRDFGATGGSGFSDRPQTSDGRTGTEPATDTAAALPGAIDEPQDPSADPMQPPPPPASSEDPNVAPTLSQVRFEQDKAIIEVQQQPPEKKRGRKSGVCTTM